MYTEFGSTDAAGSVELNLMTTIISKSMQTQAGQGRYFALDARNWAGAAVTERWGAIPPSTSFHPALSAGRLGDIDTGQRGITARYETGNPVLSEQVKILPLRLPARVGKVDHYKASEVAVR